MFHAKLEKIREIKIVIDATRDLIDVANVKLNKKGLSFQAVDTSRTALVDFHLGTKAFTELKSSQEIMLGIKFINLFKVFKCIDGDHSLEISNADEEKFVRLFFKDSPEMKLARFNLNLVTKLEDELDIPDTPYDSKVIINSEEFSRIIRDFSQISEDLNIHANHNFFSLNVKSEFIEGTIVYKNSDAHGKGRFFKMNVKGNYSGTFSLKFLNEFCRSSPLSENIILYFSENTPLVVEYVIQNYGSLRYFLASKMT